MGHGGVMGSLSPFELEDAVEAGDLAAVGALLDRGADVNACCHGLDIPVVALALWRSDVAMIELLHRHGADLDAVSSSRSLLHEQASSCEANLVLPLLLRLGWDPHRRDHVGWTALHRAAAAGHVANVKALLGAGADCGARTPHGLTASDIASNNHNTEIASMTRP
jgi:ankyrin repeat protein